MAAQTILEEIREIPAAIRATAAETRPAARQAAAAMRERSPRRIYIIGNGTSLYSSMAAAYTARVIAGPDSPLVLAMPSGDFRHFTPALNENDIIVGVSASGKFRDIIAVFERVAGQCLRIGITHVPGSPITQLADHTLISAGGQSMMPVMTMTYASTLTAIHLLMLELFAAPDSQFADLLGSADRAADGIEHAEKVAAEIIPNIKHFEHAFQFGAGCAYATALETSLKMKEMAMFHAEASETWEMASGPATMVSEKTLCVALYAGGDSDEATADGARHAREWGARVIEVGDRHAAGDWSIPVAAPKNQGFASLSLVPPMALMAYHLAKARGATPDQPQWRERYYAQGMTHIFGQ